MMNRVLLLALQLVLLQHLAAAFQFPQFRPLIVREPTEGVASTTSSVASSVKPSAEQQQQKKQHNGVASKSLTSPINGEAVNGSASNNDNSTSTTATLTEKVNGINGVNGAEPMTMIEDAQAADLIEPHPPSTPPPQAEIQSLRRQSEEKDEKIAALTQRLESLQAEANAKEAMIKSTQSAWQDKEASLLDKIGEFTRMFEEKEMDDEETAYQNERLQTEVDLLKTQIVNVQNLLKREKMTSAELKDRLDEISDTMENDQMEYQKATRTLQEDLIVQQSRLTKLQSEWREEKERFISEKQSIEAQLTVESEKLALAESEWQATQQDFEKTQKSLTEELTDQKERLKQTKREMDIDRTRFQTERASLKEAIATEQKRVKDIEQTLDIERLRFKKAQLELTRTIHDERSIVSELSKKLVDQQQRFEEEKINLEVALQLEQKRVRDIEEAFRAEKESFAAERVRLERQVEQEIQLRKEKKKEMHNRYEKIRQELTELWQGAKREGRETERKLKENYENRIAEMSLTMVQLEQEVDKTRASSQELNMMLLEARAQRDDAVKEAYQVQEKYMRLVAERNKEIAELKLNLDELRAVIRDREEQLLRYQSSYKEATKLVVRITEERTKRFRFVRRIFGRRKNA